MYLYTDPTAVVTDSLLGSSTEGPSVKFDMVGNCTEVFTQLKDLYYTSFLVHT